MKNSCVFRTGLLLPLLLVLIACPAEKSEADPTLPAAEATAPTLTTVEAAAPPAPAPARVAPQRPAPPPVPETVEQVIAHAEAEYARGQANYQAGHLESAKDNFDNAFNILLRAAVAARNDDRLQAEFDRIVDATHELELQALKAGDGFSEQHFEPAPIDEANNITFPVDPNVRAQAQAQLAGTHSDLPLMLTDPVVSYINYFSSRGHGTIERALVRRGRYMEMIARIFHEEGVPQDLVFLAQAESGFQPLALSRAGARGMWQFMPFDGLKAGLARNWWLDERQDPEKATRAAARLLRDLYNQFGDWYLAMAAYNSGPGTVQRAVQRTGYADFWELYKRNVLPGETRNYVPIILAMTIIAKNPAQYGLDHVLPDPPLAHDTVRIHYPIDLRLVAECTDSSASTLAELNPSLLRMTTPRDMDFELHLPAGTAAMYEKNVAAVPEEMRVSWRYHRVGAGESLSEIARRYHTTVAAITEANNLEGEELHTDARLIIPVAPAKASASESRTASGQSYSRTPVRYSVRKADTVLSVADDFGVPVEKVRQWNHLSGNSLAGHRTLTLFRPATAAATAAKGKGGAHGKPGKGAAAAPEKASGGKSTAAKGKTSSSKAAPAKAAAAAKTGAKSGGKSAAKSTRHKPR